MLVKVDVNFVESNKLDEILSLLREIKKVQGDEMADLTALTAQVQKNTDVENSAFQLITGLAAQIVSLKTDPAALQTLADQLNSSAIALAAAVTANTPAA